MMPLLVDQDKATQRLESLIDAAVDPVLSSDEVLDLLTDNQVAAVWSASTAFEFGAVVIPTANKRNGRKYRIVELDGDGRTSGATEPNWPTGRDSRVTDGNITWEEAGNEPKSLWNLDKAAYQGWLLKAGKVAPEFDYGDADHKMNAGQMHEHCLKQAARFKPVEVA
jgi:hypothetical protein